MVSIRVQQLAVLAGLADGDPPLVPTDWVPGAGMRGDNAHAVSALKPTQQRFIRARDDPAAGATGRDVAPFRSPLSAFSSSSASIHTTALLKAGVLDCGSHVLGINVLASG